MMWLVDLTAEYGPTAAVFVWLFMLDRKVNRLCGYVAGMTGKESE